MNAVVVLRSDAQLLWAGTHGCYLFAFWIFPCLSMNQKVPICLN